MKKLKRTYRPLFTLLLLLLFQTVSVNAQNDFKCPWDEVNCPGKCGAFHDANGDGYCDYGTVDIPVIKDTTPVLAPETTKTEVIIENSLENNSKAANILPDTQKTNTMQPDTTAIQTVNSNESLTQETHSHSTRRPYTLILISALVFVLYFLTYFLSKTKVLRKCNHRRIWNILLSLTFIGSGILGIILVIQLNYNIWMGIYREFLYWHVEFGMAMGLIGILHASWHWRYFVNLFGGWKNKNTCN